MSNGLPWFKCYPRDFNEGMIGLTMEERGVYITLLNLIYAKGDPIEDDASYFRMVFCCSLKQWTKVRAALIVKRKIFEISFNGEPCLMNKRAAEEIAEANGKSQKFSEAGRRGGQNSHPKTPKNNDLAQARLDRGLSTTDTDTEAERKNPITPNGVIAPKAEKALGSRLPEEWQPLPNYAAGDYGLSHEQHAAELFKFRDYWRAVPGAKGRKVDWDATWRNWMRRAAENNPGKRHERPNQPSAKFLARQANLERAFARSEDVADRRDLQRARG